jgi:molybdenum cofactor cytidylyltransferase
MELIDAVQLTGETRLAFVGAGGKTTAMFRLGREWVKRHGTTILLTTTTHLAEKEIKTADHHYEIEQIADFELLEAELPRGIVLVTGLPVEKERVGGLSEDLMGALYHLANEHGLPLLVEADGSKQRPLKAPAEHEPVIPPFVDTVIVVVGLQAIGKQLDDVWVHRLGQFARLTGLNKGDEITTHAVTQMLLAEDGGLKDIPAGARKMVLFNQCDTPRQAAMAKSFSKQLLKTYSRVVYASLKMEGKQEVIAVNQPVAGLVLAAGGSTRIGQPKQLLDWNGQPFVRVVAENALSSGLDPVYVVVGAHAQQVEDALKGLDVEIIRNSQWEEGQSASVKAGIKGLAAETQAVVMMLVDQPHIPPPLIEALVEAHASMVSPIVATMVEHRRGNPVLFDRITFDDLLDIEGDVGGRKIFSRYRIHYVPWLDARIGLDVDSMEDYQRLLDVWEVN